VTLSRLDDRSYLERTLPRRAQAKQIKTEVKACPGRVDGLAYGKSHGPTITRGEQLSGGPKADKTAITHVIDRVATEDNVIREMIKQTGNEIADDAFGVGRAGTARVGRISCTVLRSIQVDICIRG
jgi:hypothetical protein